MQTRFRSLAVNSGQFDGVSNFETLALVDSNNVNIDNSLIGEDFTTVEFALTDDGAGAAGLTVDITEMANGSAANVTSANILDETAGQNADDNAAGLHALTSVDLSLADATGDTDELTFRMKNTQDDEGLLENIEDFSDVNGTFTVTTLTMDGVETVNIDSSGTTGANTVATLDASNATAVNLTGDQDLNIGALTTDAATAGDAITVDASTMTGDAAVDLDIDGDYDHTVTGTANNDRFTFDDADTFNNDDVINGGEGTDTLEIANQDGDLGAIRANGIETVQLEVEATQNTAAVEHNLDLRDVSDLSSLIVDVNSAD